MTAEDHLSASAAVPGMRRSSTRSSRSRSARSASARSSPRTTCNRSTATVFRKQAEAGPRTLWRYESLLPGGPGIERVDLGAGFTPLRRADEPRGAPRPRDALDQGRLGQPVELVQGSRRLDRRHDGAGVRLRGRVVRVHRQPRQRDRRARGEGRDATATCSFPTTWSARRSSSTEAYGAKVVAVSGNYDDVNRLCTEVAEALPWAFVNVNMRPYYAEGSKTLGFETAEQLGWRLPDHVVVPIASGALLTKIHRAFSELIAIGAVEEKPYRVRGAQPEGCSPGGAGVRGRRRRGHAGEARHDRPVARDRRAGGRVLRAAGRARRPAGRSRRAPRRRSSRASGCWPRPRACSPRRPAASRSRTSSEWSSAGVIAPNEETVAFVTGNGYKTSRRSRVGSSRASTWRPTSTSSSPY